MKETSAGFPKSQSETPPLAWVAFLLLCILIASLWLLSSPPFAPISGPAGEALVFAGGALLGLLAGGRLRFGLRQLWPATAYGVLLFFVAYLLQQLPSASRIDGIAISALVPAGVVMLLAFRRFGSLQGGNFLPAAVGGFAGLLLVLPVAVPSSLPEILRTIPPLFAAAAIAYASVGLYSVARATTPASLILTVCLPNALLFLADAALTHDLNAASLLAISPWSGSLALLQLGLLLYLLSSMDPRRLSVRFLLVPLLTTLEGSAILREWPSARIAAGLALSAASAAYLLFGSTADDTLPPSLR